MMSPYLKTNTNTIYAVLYDQDKDLNATAEKHQVLLGTNLSTQETESETWGQ